MFTQYAINEKLFTYAVSGIQVRKSKLSLVQSCKLTNGPVAIKGSSMARFTIHTPFGCWLACWRQVDCAKTAELIVMQFGRQTHVGPTNYVGISQNAVVSTGQRLIDAYWLL